MKTRGIKDKEKAEKIIKSELSVDSILNQTWIYSNTNRNIISDKLPSVYLEEIMMQYGGGVTGKKKLIEIMQSHCINAEAVDALLKDDFLTFFNERKKTIIYEFKTTGFVQNIIDQQPSENEED
jgi:hypothetical protein